MKQFVMCLTKGSVIIIALVTISYACWITVPIEKLVDSADVIVIATITSIVHAESIPDGQNSTYVLAIYMLKKY
ncbi:hypothetical protein K8I28_13880 [bacterium]|nr:hypothetical protein [bacterium]